MLRKLESLKQDLGDGVSALAQRTVHAAQEYLLNPFAIQVKIIVMSNILEIRIYSINQKLALILHSSYFVYSRQSNLVTYPIFRKNEINLELISLCLLRTI